MGFGIKFILNLRIDLILGCWLFYVNIWNVLRECEYENIVNLIFMFCDKEIFVFR